MAISKQWKKPSRSVGQRLLRFSSKNFLRLFLILALLSVISPIFFLFRMRRIHRMQLKKCGWLDNPPLICAHGGDSSKALPNTMNAYRLALLSQVDCIEIDVSRTSDGVLYALHDRDLQQISGNATAKVGYMSTNEIKAMGAGLQFQQEYHGQEIPTAEDALAFISKLVKQVILDVKVGPPSYEKEFASDVLSVVKKTDCRNCLIWAKSDTLGRDVIRLSQDFAVGYIIMKDPLTGKRTNMLRMKNAKVAGVYHHLVDEKLMRILHGAGKKVYAWTVDDEDSMKRMLLERVDAVVTSHPTVLQHLMQDIRTQCREEGFPFP